MNSFGHNFRITVFGESHGVALGVVMDGLAAGIPLAAADFEGDLARRRSGAAGTTRRREGDIPEIVSGVFEGHTTGAPLTVLFRNDDARPGDYAKFSDHPRPSHADFTAARKFGGLNDPRGGGHFSGRVTLALVAAGVVAKKILGEGVSVSSEITEIGGCRDKTLFESVVVGAVKDGDSVGGIIECRATGIAAGLGEPFFDSIESVASHLMFSIPGVRGVEFGSGFAGARMRATEHNDPIIDARGTTSTNNAGGVNGGISNGNEIVVRIAMKPAASIPGEQHSWNFATGRIEALRIAGRHDACIALRAAVVAEAALAIALADLTMS